MIILDVREKEEFQAEHVPDSISCPLSSFEILAPGILKNIKDSEVLIMCRTGSRAKMALNELRKIDTDHNKFKIYEGGILNWKSQGKDVIGEGSIFPIMRQVQIVASSMIFFAFIGSQIITHDLVYLALFVGFGLALAGYTGFCPMVFILQKMPWNKKRSVVSSSSKKSCCG